MTWTAKFLSATDLQSEIDSGAFADLYDASKDAIEDGNYIYNSDSNLTDNEKKDHWLGIMQNYASNSTIAPNGKNYEYAVLGAYKDSVLKILHSGFYCSDTNIWNTDHGLVGLVDGSKSYIYTEDFWKPQTAAVKSKWDPEHWNFKAVPGSQIAFRINTSRPASESFDYATMLEVDVEESLTVNNPSVDPAPTEDGSTKTNDTIDAITIKEKTTDTRIKLK